MPETIIVYYVGPSLLLRALHEAHFETCLISGILLVIPKTET
jgi:hypothetical protein